MRLRAMALAVIAAALLAACGNNTKGVVIERHDGVNGIPKSAAKCVGTEWMLVVDQGDKIKPSDRFKKICVPFAEAVKYKVGDAYP